jgi:phage tail tape-measure protein
VALGTAVGDVAGVAVGAIVGDVAGVAVGAIVGATVGGSVGVAVGVLLQAPATPATDRASNMEMARRFMRSSWMRGPASPVGTRDAPLLAATVV